MSTASWCRAPAAIVLLSSVGSMESLRRLASNVASLGFALAVGAVAAALAAGIVFGGAGSNAVPPIALAALLVLLCFPLIRWAVGPDPTLRAIAYGGLVAKIGGTVLRFQLTADSSDALLYNARGARIAGWLAEGMVWPNEHRVQGGGHGTTNLSYVVGWFYHRVGVDKLTAYVAWAFLGFLGLLLIFRAASAAVPQLDRRRYALLLFFLPSLLFWPASLGKDAWMLCALGFATTGVAAVTSHRYSLVGMTSLAFGLLMAGWIRPHVAALATVALLSALIWPGRVGKNVLQQVIGLIIAVAILLVAIDQVAEFFGSERFEVTAVLDKAESVSAEGGSEFDPTPITSPANFAPGLFTVIFRPFPFEASSIVQLMTGFESLAILGLALIGLGRLRTVPRAFTNNGMIRFAVIYLLGFVVAFSVISNFGILARQRAQMWPYLLMLISLKPSAALKRHRTVAAATTGSTA